MGRVLTLLYHRVRYYEEDIQLLAVTPEHFCEQMEWLKENYPIVGFDEDWSNVQADSVCITFDDGYQDNFLTAVPILNKLQIPATIFVTTGNIDTDYEMWWDELERNILSNKGYPKAFHLSDELFECTWDTSTAVRREDLYYTMHWLMKQISVERRNDWIQQLRAWNGYQEKGRAENRCLQTGDLKDLDMTRIMIGAHTVNHPVLSRLSAEEQRSEIETSKQKLEALFKRPALTFSYPFGGVSDYNGKTIAICKELGFTKVAANVPGIWEKGDALYEVPRHLVRDWNLEQFKERMKMFWEGI